MDDAVICGQLRQIFPQIEPTVIQRTVEEAKTNEGVDILTHCIEVVLARQEAARLSGNSGREGNDDVVVVKSIRKQSSRKAKSRDIPLVFIKDTDPVKYPDPLDFDIRQGAHQPFSDYDSDSSNSENESSDGEATERIDKPIHFKSQESSPDYPNIRYMNNNNYSSPMRDEFFNDDLDRLIANVETPPKAVWRPSATPNRQPSATPINLQPFATSINRLTSATPNRHLSATPTQQTLATPINQQPSATPIHMQPSATPINQQPSVTPNQQRSITPNQQNTPSSSTTSTLTATSLLDFVKQMFPKVNIEFVQNLSQQGVDLNGIVNMLIDRPDMQNSGPSEPQQSPKEPAKTKDVDYFTDYSEIVSHSCSWQCEQLLRNEFRRVSVNDIRKAMRICNNHYAPARKLLEEALLAMSQNGRGKSLPKCSTLPSISKSPSSSSSTPKKKFTISRLLASRRTWAMNHHDIHPDLKLEIDFVKKEAVLNEEKKNAIYAAHLNEQQYKDEGELIECGCCFGEFPFEEIVQCSDGHLFCKECLHGYAKEIIFGSAMASVKLTCMGEDCVQPFPYNQLEKCLTKDEIEKYQGRLQEDCLAKADIPNLHQCPFCEFAAIIPAQQKVFTCMNPNCRKESCTECKEDWKEHFGKRCNEVEKKSQTNLRLGYEERMTMAKVRKCSKCSLTFTKLDGCNKMTCRCGTTQCYVCRKSPITYEHFCRHPRDPGKKCKKCAACSLWTDPTEDDELAIKQLQDEAVVAKRKLMEEIEQSTSKKQKV